MINDNWTHFCEFLKIRKKYFSHEVMENSWGVSKWAEGGRLAKSSPRWGRIRPWDDLFLGGGTRTQPYLSTFWFNSLFLIQLFLRVWC